MNDAEMQEKYALAQQLYSEQNFVPALVVGAAATVLASTAYAIVVAKWTFSYGFATAGIGIVVGLAMQFLGRGIEAKFAVASAGYTIAGFALGSIFWPVMSTIFSGSRSPLDILSDLSLHELIDSSLGYVSPVTLVYLFIAVSAAVFLVKRPLSRSQRLAIGIYNSRRKREGDTV